MWEFFIEHGANLVAFLALIALCYQILSANQQFRLLNKGYLHAEPRLDLGGDNVVFVRQIGGGDVVLPDTPIDALNPVVKLSNLGNLPLKYRVLNFDVWFNDAQQTGKFEDTDHVIGVLFPKQDGLEFRRKGLRLLTTGPMRFADVMNLQIKIYIRVEYHAGAEKPSYFDRHFDYRIMGNMASFVIRQVNDRW